MLAERNNQIKLISLKQKTVLYVNRRKQKDNIIVRTVKTR